MVAPKRAEVFSFNWVSAERHSGKGDGEKAHARLHIARVRSAIQQGAGDDSMLRQRGHGSAQRFLSIRRQRRQRLPKIHDQVSHVFKPDRQPNQIIGTTAAIPFGRRPVLD